MKVFFGVCCFGSDFTNVNFVCRRKFVEIYLLAERRFERQTSLELVELRLERRLLRRILAFEMRKRRFYLAKLDLVLSKRFDRKVGL